MTRKFFLEKTQNCHRTTFQEKATKNVYKTTFKKQAVKTDKRIMFSMKPHLKKKNIILKKKLGKNDPKGKPPQDL